MDLRPYDPTPAQLDRARELAFSGLLNYSPYTFSDDFSVGVGLEFIEEAENLGLIYCADRDKNDSCHAGLTHLLVDHSKQSEFLDANARLSTLYETMIDMVQEHLPVGPDFSVADFGCNAGYFPLRMNQRWGCKSVGYDVVDFTATFELLNEICGTQAEFINEGYSPARGEYPQPARYDLCCSIAVLVHLSDPLHHLAFLGKMATKALLVWTWSTPGEDDALLIRYRGANRYYKDATFPYCFDFTQISPGLLRKSLKLMGFNEIHKIRNRPGSMPDSWFTNHCGYLAIRSQEERKSRGIEIETGDSPAQPQLVKSLEGYNIVSLGLTFLGIPQSAGDMDLRHADLNEINGLIVADSCREVEEQIIEKKGYTDSGSEM